MRVMPILLELLAECHDRPAHYFTPTIRRQLIEHCFIIDNGDDMDKQERVVSLEQQVQMLVRVLEQLRQTLLRQGQWSDAPVTPQMYG